MRLALLGLFGLWMSVTTLSGPAPTPPADTGSWTDTGDAGDTGDTGESGDTGDTGDTRDTGETGDTYDTGDSGDTGDTGTVDTGWTDGKSAAELANETGGFGCATSGGGAGLAVVLLGVGMLVFRREE